VLEEIIGYCALIAGGVLMALFLMIVCGGKYDDNTPD